MKCQNGLRISCQHSGYSWFIKMVERMDLAVHIQFADAKPDKLRALRPEIKDQDYFLHTFCRINGTKISQLGRTAKKNQQVYFQSVTYGKLMVR